jgi:hypothetical protein
MIPIATSGTDAFTSSSCPISTSIRVYWPFHFEILLFGIGLLCATPRPASLRPGQWVKIVKAITAAGTSRRAVPIASSQISRLVALSMDRPTVRGAEVPSAASATEAFDLFNP